MLFWFTGLVVLVVVGWLLGFAELAGCWRLMVGLAYIDLVLLYWFVVCWL